jgi:hypothetical protein
MVYGWEHMKAEYVIYKDNIGYFIMPEWEWEILDQHLDGRKCMIDISYARLLESNEQTFAAQDILSRMWSGDYGSDVENPR